MPYLSFDLDAKKLARRAATALGVEPGAIAWGLLELWEHAWEAKTDTVSDLAIDGCFGPHPRVREALVEYGFIIRTDSGWRVRGADRYLRIAKAQSEAGKAKAGNLKQNQPQPAPVRVEPVVEPEKTTGSFTEHRTPNTESSSKEEERSRPQIGATITAPETDPDTWTADDFWRWAQALRREGGLIPEKPPNHRKLSAWWTECLMTEGVTAEAMKQGFHAFGESSHWEKATPPYPFGAFMSEWTKYTKPEVRNDSPA